MILYEKTNLPETLKKLRVSQKISQAKLAEKLKCSRHEIINIERSNRAPNYKTLCCWIRACGGELILRVKTKGDTEIPIEDTEE
ncbi:MAG: helix-turn-helix transcriptional regulator [Synergistaceae bacterium]|nr:helix-turn-helix transcriptional regulator [Synergistaceae bacterium]